MMLRKRFPRWLPVVLSLQAILFVTDAGADDISGTVAVTLAGGDTGTVAVGETLSVSSDSDQSIKISGTAGAVTIINAGTITQTGDEEAIFNEDEGFDISIENAAGAVISSSDADAIKVEVGSTLSLNNYGTIESTGGQALDLNKMDETNIVNNFATALIQADDADAVRPGEDGIVNNDGTIKSISEDDGIDVQENSGVTIVNAATAASGLIEGGRHGITGGESGSFTISVTNNLGGTIQGDNGSGINIDGDAGLSATIVNHGMITGYGTDGDGDGIDVDGIANITNTGIIRSINAYAESGMAYSEGISIGGGIVVNSGTIEGLVADGNATAVGRGITLTGNDIEDGDLAGTREAIYGDAVVTNNAGGLIRGESDAAIVVEGPASISDYTVEITNNSGAAIQGGGTTNAAIWVRADNVTTNPNVTLNNYGTIDGSSSGKAIALGKGNDAVNLFDGTVTGSLDGGDGTDALTFSGWSGKLSDSVVNWETIDLTDASTVDLPESKTEAGQFMMSFDTMTIDATSTLLADGDSPGFYTLVGEITNTGTISLMDDLDAEDRLTITGNYIGDSGTIKLDLDSSTSTADHVSISGTATGTTVVELNEIGGTVASPSSPVELIWVDGETTEGAFTFSQMAIGAGYYDPLITYSEGTFDFTGYTFAGYRNEAALMQAVTGFVDRLGFESVTDFHARHIYTMLASGAKAQPGSIWVRGYGSSFRLGQEGDAATSMSGYSLGTQFGGDLTAGQMGSGAQYHAGAFGGTGYQKADVKGITTDKAGKLTQQVWNVGLYGSMERPGCYYFEGVLQAGYHDVTITSDDEVGELNTDTWGLVASLEAGTQVQAGEGFRVDPRAQLIWQHTGEMNLSTAMGDVSIDNHNGFMGILGTTGTFTKTGLPFNPFVDVVLTRDFSADTHVDYAESGKRLSSNPERTQLGGSVGIASASTHTGSLTYFVKAGAMYGLDGQASYDYSCTAGLNKTF